ncbi:MAG: hypothetical protein J1E38_09915 [Paramuribaculum sp.]|nr:hypothetical protein [Paramuribaculum sp.]
MIQKFNIDDIACDLVKYGDAAKIAYMIYPGVEPLPASWIQQTAVSFDVSIAVLYVPGDQWDNYLTPWPAPGETKNSNPFLGQATEFLQRLKNEIIPEVEKRLGMSVEPERNLIGVSLSGLFTLWQWLLGQTFKSIACLSGSFWYPGFIDWFMKQPLTGKEGQAFFLLGKKEPGAWLKEYRSVGKNTEAIVDRLKLSGIATDFVWVPGDHFADPLGRAHLAFQALFS